MSFQPSHGTSGAVRRFAGWVARGSVGHPLLDGIEYWNELRDSPSQMEICFAIFERTIDDLGRRTGGVANSTADDPAAWDTRRPLFDHLAATVDTLRKLDFVHDVSSVMRVEGED